MSYKILVINPGSTSTKIGVYEDETLLFEETLRHSTEEIAKYATIVDQKDFRKEVILDVLKEKNVDLNDIDVVVGRGGLLKPIPGGTYATTPELLEDLKVGKQGQPASNLGGILASEIAAENNVPSYIVAKEVGKNYQDLNSIVVDMGAGVSVGAHKNGKVVDVANALDGDGPFSPERSGGLPTGALVKACFSGKYTQAEVGKMLNGNGGFNAYVGSNDMRDLLKMIEEGDKKAEAVVDAFHYQLCKEIGAMSVVLGGKVDQIILTGGIAYSAKTQADMKNAVEWIAPVTVYPGEDELLALAQGALRVMNGEEEAKVY